MEYARPYTTHWAGSETRTDRKYRLRHDEFWIMLVSKCAGGKSWIRMLPHRHPWQNINPSYLNDKMIMGNMTQSIKK